MRRASRAGSRMQVLHSRLAARQGISAAAAPRDMFQKYRFQKREVGKQANSTSADNRGEAEAASLSPAPLTPSPSSLAVLASLEERTPRPRKKARSAPVEETFSEADPGVPELLGDQPLRLVIVGVNPSGHAWRSGHYYSSPSNRMWPILRETGIAPPGIRGAEDDRRMPAEAGVGFVDVGCGTPGTRSAAFSSETMQAWAPAFFARLAGHMARASASLGCACGRCGAPALVVFAGKRQWLELLNRGRRGRAKVVSVPGGLQTLRPEGWPLPEASEVWVLPSTSGAAPMTIEERIGPYRLLAARLAAIPRTRPPPDCCAGGG